MKNTWRHFLRRIVAVSGASIATAWSSAMCYAVQLAYDSASDPVYADGWQAGDDGGTGFTAWNFDARFGSGANYTFGGIGIDDGLQTGTATSNPFNNIGQIDMPPNADRRTWKISTTPTDTGAPHIGRGLEHPLQKDQTLSIVLDNPTKRQFFKGYHVMLNGNTGGMNGNICNPDKQPCSPGGTPVNKLAWWRFEYADDGIWKVGDNSGDFETDEPKLFDTDTAAGGMRLDVTLTDADTYKLRATPLANPANFYEHEGPLRNPGTTLDWIEFVFYNPVTDTGTPPTTATDLYIRSMTITGPAPAGVPGDYNKNSTVDAADYVVWRDHLGQTFQLDNEVSGVTPGMVTAEDYGEWRARFGNISGSGAGNTAAIAAVPEPSTFIYFVAALGCLAYGGRRVRRD